jgi:hypothetical protein
VDGDGEEDARLKPNDMIICVNNKKGKRDLVDKFDSELTRYT